jgi:hypothetical protein
MIRLVFVRGLSDASKRNSTGWWAGWAEVLVFGSGEVHAYETRRIYPSQGHLGPVESRQGDTC